MREGPIALAGSESRTPPFYSASALAHGAARSVVEVLSGRRPLHQIRRWLSRPVAGLLTSLTRSGAPLDFRTRMNSVHACPTNSSTVEVCVVIGEPQRHRAMALRLERLDSGWSCTLLSLV
ncbi:Rv3235 family protein [Actinopolyspora erythraea]|uniref:Rv3235 family protein n=1 Tax=Actinopolyspora erythraea TaxID=414996 RepID=UPI0011864800|nr:Rv3235 family protein [Actinopolyspora erythraea]